MRKKLLLFVVLFTINFSIAQSIAPPKSKVYNYDEVTTKPEFVGGYDKFIKFIGNNYSLQNDEGASGTVKVSFIIEINGAVTNVEIIEDAGGGTGDEARRVLSISPLWIPGRQDGRLVRVLHEFPIKLSN